MRDHKQVVGVAICAIAAAFSTMAFAVFVDAALWLLMRLFVRR